MSNMLYACSILYKTKLPLLLAFNKTDVVSNQFAIDWMADYETFQGALRDDGSFMDSYVQSMSLVLDEFYQHLRVGALASTQRPYVHNHVLFSLPLVGWSVCCNWSWYERLF